MSLQGHVQLIFRALASLDSDRTTRSREDAVPKQGIPTVIVSVGTDGNRVFTYFTERVSDHRIVWRITAEIGCCSTASEIRGASKNGTRSIPQHQCRSVDVVGSSEWIKAGFKASTVDIEHAIDTTVAQGGIEGKASAGPAIISSLIIYSDRASSNDCLIA